MSFSTPTVHMGLPSPGTDFEEFNLDLNQYLIKNPTATFFMKLSSNELAQQGFVKNDILVVDRSKLNTQKPQVFESEGEFKVFAKNKQPPNDSVFWGTVVGLARKV
jgi:DNA polymerase V